MGLKGWHAPPGQDTAQPTVEGQLEEVPTPFSPQGLRVGPQKKIKVRDYFPFAFVL